MNLFDKLVNEALENQTELSPLRVVVEKELLHHDILKIMSQHNLLKNLTFIGGTCLRACYGGTRLSEDLDFTGGREFSRYDLSEMGRVLTECLHEKYNLPVVVHEPIKDINNVDTWKIKIETRPKKRDIPAQRINIDICAINSYEKQPMLLLNSYGVDMGTQSLAINAQSREEIYVDKLLAFALRPNRMKYRDLWDIVWLHQQRISPRLELIPKKLADRNLSDSDFKEKLNERTTQLSNDKNHSRDFQKEMMRFIPAQHSQNVLDNTDYWSYLTWLINDLNQRIQN